MYTTGLLSLWSVNVLYYFCTTFNIGAISAMFYSESLLPHTLFNMSCTGDESTLFDCDNSTEVPDGSNCYSSEDAAVICQGWDLVHVQGIML